MESEISYPGPALRFLCNSSPSVDDVAYCFKHLPSDDPLLRLLVDSACKFGQAQNFFQLGEKEMEILPRAFLYHANRKLVTQMTGLWSRSKSEKPEWLKRSNYHIPGTEMASDSNDKKKSRGEGNTQKKLLYPKPRSRVVLLATCRGIIEELLNLAHKRS